ncbi:MAG TPA: stage II sporulation protein R [Firmicutes bacterium]|nr:stage II sporulation protein R [Bacillota bacterium]
MRGRRAALVAMMLLSMLVAGTPAAPASTEALLRLHVRAHSNAPADQALKYAVRDAVLAVLAGLPQPQSTEEALRQTAAALPLVLEAARDTVAAAGRTYPVQAVLGPAAFPTRMYGEKVYRAGTYQALQIYLGEGRGRNWWCVLFPPLCFFEAEGKSRLQAETVAARPHKTAPLPPFKSRLLLWLQRLFDRS